MAIVEKFGAAIAPSVTARLGAAEARRVEIENEVASLALDEVLGRAGVAEKREKLEADLATATATVNRLRHAERQARERDAAAATAANIKALRVKQAGFEKLAAARLAAMTELCGGLEIAAKGYSKFMSLTDRMAIVMPSGMIAHKIAWHEIDTLIRGVAMPAPIDKILASEMFRVAVEDDDGRRRVLPGGAPVIEQLRLEPGKIEPALQGVLRMHEYLLGQIRNHIERIEAAAAPQLAKSA